VDLPPRCTSRLVTVVAWLPNTLTCRFRYDGRRRRILESDGATGTETCRPWRGEALPAAQETRVFGLADRRDRAFPGCSGGCARRLRLHPFFSFVSFGVPGV
jgi:hypothetical protein